MGVTKVVAAVSLTALLAGCGGGGSATTAAVGGIVADGYLVNAVAFLDRNGNYEWDEGEPKTTTGPGGVYSLLSAEQDIH